MTHPKVSVIIPVYNLEKYLGRCLGSVRSQTLKDIEIVCINDGSTDRSLDILQEYERVDPRIIIINKENEGQGTARNIGIDAANGEYIGFVDGDDWIEPEMYEKMYENAQKHDLDIQICTVRFVDDRGRDRNIQCDYDRYIGSRFRDESMIFDRNHIIDEIFTLNRFGCVNKLYNIRFLRKNNIFFSSQKYMEDLIFHFQTFLRAERISIIRKPFYKYHRFRQGSTTTQEKYTLPLFDIFKEIEMFFKKTGMGSDLLQRLDKCKIRKSIAAYYMTRPELKKQYFDLMKQEFGRMEIPENPFISFSEKSVFYLARTMPFSVFRHTDIALNLYVSLFHRILKN